MSRDINNGELDVLPGYLCIEDQMAMKVQHDSP